MDRNEQVTASYKIQKQSSMGWWQDRMFFVTNVRVYYLQAVKAFDRKIKLEYILGVTKSLDEGNRELVIHVRDQYDFRFRAHSDEEREDIILALREVY